eukprot:790167-Rhodomonas_salina.1
MAEEDEEEEVDIVAVDERVRHNIEVMQDLMYRVQAFINEHEGRALITEFQYWGRSEDGMYYLRRTDPWVYRPERGRSVLPYREHVQPEVNRVKTVFRITRGEFISLESSAEEDFYITVGDTSGAFVFPVSME